MRFLTLHTLLLAAVPIFALGFAGEASVVTINLDNVLLIDGKRIFPIGFTMPPPLDGKTPEGRNGLQELAEAGATFMHTGTQGENWNAATIILGTDIYPISYPPGTHSLLTNKNISLVGDHTRIMMEVAEGKLPVWMALQISWSGVLKPGKTLRFPTFPEERFMAYQAVINGARGLNFFGGSNPTSLNAEDAKLGWNWTFWRRVMRPLMDEIGPKSLLYPALVAPNSKLPVKVSDADNMEFCVREANKDLFILACKREGVTAKVEFSGLPASASEAEVMFESPRTVKAKDGKFTDWFAPFEVHVYRFKLQP